ncbi:YqhG family protein [Tumebacillus permanentifrigoris]|uniref:Uncharacterized protein YqhG n=1 Tax=Tumebacillus permanentifrigoris TaxID=378543 RepID=A0A316D5L0_9BACL|nr:YqhG family protein [Tumebacillus permanentifrigoris]PWK06299.1 uncharacterized protein YqhG [Tumebacillus permanentifrigoris]
MQSQEEIQDFCRRYFQAVKAPLLQDEPAYLQVELPRDVDKELIDRPWHWMMVETIYKDIPNTVKHLIFQQDLQREDMERPEYLTFGSLFLSKMIDSTKKRGSCTCGYQQGAMLTGTTLVPVLMITCKLSLIADRCRDEIVSYGVHLLTGEVYHDFYERVEGLTFTPQPSQLVQVETAKLSMQQGFTKIRDQVHSEIQAMNHTWAIDAQDNLSREREQLETYYQSLGLVNADTQLPDEEKAAKATLFQAELRLRLEELEWRCAPRVKIEPFQFALLYLSETVLRGANVSRERFVQ